MPFHPSTASTHYLRSRMARVCVAITGNTAEEMLARADAVVRENPFLEFRLDSLDKPLTAIPQLREFLYERSEVTAIATCRRVAGGGRFKGAAAAEIDVLTQASAAGFHLVDLEIETAEALSKAQYAAFRAALGERGTGLMLSSHDFEATGNLGHALDRLLIFEPEFVKIVSTAKSLGDNLAMMRLLGERGESANLVGICMGEQGLISRVLGVRAGSMFTFAAATEGEETGPGQIAARTLRETYRIDQVEAATRVYGVAGSPIRHSLSPLMQNTAFRRESVNAVFLALETKKLADLLNVMRELPIHGLAVTMPLKQEILPYLAKTDALSAKIGACNTVVRAQDGRLFGFNTDVGGITRPLERRLALRGARVLVLGAGGVARAAVFGLVEKGAEVTILNRTPETAQKLARQAKARTIRREQVAKAHFDVILNATPAGMTGQRLTSILEAHELNTRIVFDTVYNPVDTPLIRMAREKGLPVITGVEMFVQQGARQFEIWTGKPAPEEEMMRVVLHALRKRLETSAPETKPEAKTDTKPGREAEIKVVERPSSSGAKVTVLPVPSSPVLKKPASGAGKVLPLTPAGRASEAAPAQAKQPASVQARPAARVSAGQQDKTLTQKIAKNSQKPASKGSASRTVTTPRVPPSKRPRLAAVEIPALKSAQKAPKSATAKAREKRAAQKPDRRAKR